MSNLDNSKVHDQKGKLQPQQLADFGVPEIWTYEDDALGVYCLQNDGSYARQASSAAFPFLPLESVQGFLDRRNATDETTWIRSFRKWARTLSRG